MGLLDDIVLSPDERLKVECAPIERIDARTKALAKKMLRVMYAAEGCGLAGPQVGELSQIVVIDVDYNGSRKKRNPYVLINPEVVVADGEPSDYNEGCLSFPGISVCVTRPSHVIVRAYDLDGNLMQYEAAENLLAVCLQHEIDHLHGITMIDHLTPTRRMEALRDYEAALAQGARPGDVE